MLLYWFSLGRSFLAFFINYHLGQSVIFPGLRKDFLFFFLAYRGREEHAGGYREGVRQGYSCGREELLQKSSTLTSAPITGMIFLLKISLEPTRTLYSVFRGIEAPHHFGDSDF